MASTILSDNGVSSGSAGLKSSADSTGVLALQTSTSGGAATTALTIDTSQNVGIGTTSPTVRLQVQGTTDATQRIVVNGSGNYSSLKLQYNGTEVAQFQNYQNSEVSIGATASAPLYLVTNNTTRMTIDSSGNVGINTSSPAGRFHVAPGSAASASTAGSAIIMQAQQGGSSAAGGNILIGSGQNGSGGSNGYVAFGIGSITSGSAFSSGEAMRISPNGNVLIGATSQAYPTLGYMLGLQSGGSQTLLSIAKSGQTLDSGGMVIGLDAGASYLNIRENIPLTFGTNNTERARIDSSGTFIVGATSSTGNSERTYFFTSVAGYLSRFTNSHASNPYGIYELYSAVSPNNTTNEFIRFDDNSATRFNVRSNGGISNYSANNVNLSDRREKTNFAPAKPYLDIICNIPVQTFNYIDQNKEQDDGLTLGVVAQDVQAVAPELVHESNWANKDEPEKIRLSIYQTDLQYALMKAIQELNAKVTALEAK